LSVRADDLTSRLERPDGAAERARPSGTSPVRSTGVDRQNLSPAPADTGKCVAILLATMNGSAFIDDQLSSIAAQTHANWCLLVSDDGSTDDTRERVARFAAAHPQRVVVIDGPRRGACANFLSMAADPAIDADYYAFCDQDDIWYADKLVRALAVLDSVPADVPALYGGRTELVDIDGRTYGYSPLFRRRPEFRNALVQSIIGGNTIVFNRATKRLIEAGGTPDIASHDWWAYQLVSLAGGVVHYDPQPAVRYRQHGNNLVGSNRGFMAGMARLREAMGGRYSRWNRSNMAALQNLPATIMVPENKTVLDRFAAARASARLTRLYWLWLSGVYRQTLLGNVGLFAAALLGKI
jgi:glycosyltransferase involved in cell wall biosynthesis